MSFSFSGFSLIETRIIGLALNNYLWSLESRQQRGMRAHQLVLYFKKSTEKLCVIMKPQIRMRVRFASWNHGGNDSGW